MITVDEKRERVWTFGIPRIYPSYHISPSFRVSTISPILPCQALTSSYTPDLIFHPPPKYLTLKVCSSKPLLPPLFQLFIALSDSFFASLLCPSPLEKWLLQPKGTTLVVNYHSAKWLRQTDSFSSSCFLCFSPSFFSSILLKKQIPHSKKDRGISKLMNMVQHPPHIHPSIHPSILKTEPAGGNGTWIWRQTLDEKSQNK